MGSQLSEENTTYLHQPPLKFLKGKKRNELRIDLKIGHFYYVNPYHSWSPSGSKVPCKFLGVEKKGKEKRAVFKKINKSHDGLNPYKISETLYYTLPWEKAGLYATPMTKDEIKDIALDILGT